MKPYEKYVSSGVDWIGDIPEGWEVKKLKYVVSLYPPCKSNHISDEDVVTFTPMDCVKNGYFHNQPSEFSNASSSYNFFEEGDILLAKVTPCFENGNIAIAKNLYNKFGYGSSELFVLRCNKCITEFMFYYFQSTDFKQVAISTMYGAGGLKRVSAEFMRENKFAMPTLDEQKAIANYLDAETARIDNIIKAKETLIERLKEKRTALITHAVTKGLDSNCKMKPSGIDWIGDIPVDWEIKKLKYLAQKPLMYGANESPDAFDESLPRYIRITDIDENGNLREDIAVSLDMEKARPYLLKKNDILFARSGATVGKSYIFNEDIAACFAGYMIRFEPKPSKVLPKFAYYVTFSKLYLNWIESNTIQATIQNVSAEKYNNFYFPLPCVNVQHEIVSFLEAEAKSIDLTITKTQTSMDKLKEYRTALISACVTGKLDVRSV